MKRFAWIKRLFGALDWFLILGSIGSGLIGLSVLWMRPSFSGLSTMVLVVPLVAAQFLLIAAFVVRRLGRGATPWRWKVRLPSVSVERGVRFAALLAGQCRNMGPAWLDYLRGDPEKGETLTTRQKWQTVAGFFWAAMRFRLSDWFAWAWPPVEWTLKKRSRRDGVVAMAVGGETVYIMSTDGLHTLLTYGWAWNTACGGAAWVLMRWLGKIRGIELASDEDPSEGG